MAWRRRGSGADEPTDGGVREREGGGGDVTCSEIGLPTDLLFSHSWTARFSAQLSCAHTASKCPEYRAVLHNLGRADISNQLLSCLWTDCTIRQSDLVNASSAAGCPLAATTARYNNTGTAAAPSSEASNAAATPPTTGPTDVDSAALLSSACAAGFALTG